MGGYRQSIRYDTIRYGTIRYGTIRTVTHESDRCAGLACVSLSAGEQTGGKTERARDARRSPRTAADANEGGDVEEASMTVSMCLCIYACVGFQKNEAASPRNSSRLNSSLQHLDFHGWCFARRNSYCVDRSGSHRYLFTREESRGYLVVGLLFFISTG